MRVTFGSIFRNGLIDINRTTEQLAIRQREVSSGQRIHLPSDDPAAMAAAMGERSEMAVLDQCTPTSSRSTRGSWWPTAFSATSSTA